MHSTVNQCIAKLFVWPCAVVAVLCLNTRLLFAGLSETPATKGDTHLEFAYDYLGRRFEKKVYEGSVLVKHQKFVYDGFKQIAEYDALNSNALANTYVWQPVGLDVPLLLRNGSEFLVSDANKNIVALLDTTGSVTDTYIYDPFGNCTQTGISANPFRFSSEYYDDETGLVYYNYRYYSPALDRWIARDLIEEKGGVNLYALCLNSSLNLYDRLGLDRLRLFYDLEFLNVSTQGWVSIARRSQYNWGEWPGNGRNVALVPSLQAASYLPGIRGLYTNLRDIRAHYRGHYNPDSQPNNRECYCIEHLYIAQHGNERFFFLGENRLNGTVLTNWQRGRWDNDEEVMNANRNDILDEFINNVKPHLCNQATIDFVQCYSFSDKENKNYIEHYLKYYMPSNVKVILHEGITYLPKEFFSR